MSDKDFSSVNALLHFDGSNGSTTMTDVTGRTWTANGNAQLSTAQQKWGASSLLLDGSGDYLTSAHNAALSISNSLWTLEMWVRVASFSQINTCFYKRTNTTDNGEMSMWINTNGTLNIQGFNSSTPVISITTTNAVSLNTWAHIAHTRDTGGIHRLFVNGVLGISGTESNTITTNTFDLYVGRANGFGTARDFNGNIDDFRLTKGVCRYTANFRPPQGPFSDAKRTGTAGTGRQPVINKYR